MIKTILRSALAALVLGCASRAANTLPQPRVVLLRSIPDDAAVEWTCNGEVRHARTPVRLQVPPRDEACLLEMNKTGYRPARQRFDWMFVVTKGTPLHVEEHHELDPDRVTSPIDVLLFPLQRLGDRVQNAVQGKLVPDYEITIELLPQISGD